MAAKGQIAVKQKGATVDVVWTIDVGDFATRSTPGDEELCSAKFDVIPAVNTPLTRWELMVEMSADEEVGLYLCADEDQLKEVKHRAHFTISFGNRSDQETGRKPLQAFSIDATDWGLMKATTRAQLFTEHSKDEKITINACITVCSDQTEEFTRDLHGQKLRKLFDSQQKMSHFVVACEDKEIVACKELVKMGSPVLAAMLDTDMKEAKENKLTITDFKYEVVEVMLRFLSTGEVTEQTDTAQLLLAADKYQINVLKQVCVDRLMRGALTLDNACQCFKVADLCQVQDLKDAAAELICANYKTVEATEEWQTFLEGDFSLVKELLAMCAEKLEILGNEKK